MKQLGELDERLCRVVELRFYGALSVEETAKALGIGQRTVERSWSKARALLHHWLREDEIGESDGAPA